ncbi:hypothetical protein LOAG_11438 [Loa loa]|uniref:Uncharacterized protein n=1 Tax=Loa loa TaxID=7209 RepID=A0A1S0TP74_LOALO|nr:hypothetical protein LOAG_11438 [Loa loa]EFO17065.1 hypothetical protein LOAG_11438 [Loa loa]
MKDIFQMNLIEEKEKEKRKNVNCRKKEDGKRFHPFSVNRFSQYQKKKNKNGKRKRKKCEKKIINCQFLLELKEKAYLFVSNRNMNIFNYVLMIVAVGANGNVKDSGGWRSYHCEE